MDNISKLSSLPTGKAVPSRSAGLATRSTSSVPSSVPSSGSSSRSGLGSWSWLSYLPIVGQAVGSIVSFYQARKERQYQKQLIEEQRRQALDDRRHDEWYNSPAQQLMRLKMAGVAPTQFGDVATTDSDGLQVKGSPESATSAMVSMNDAVNSGFSSALNALSLGKQRAEIDKIYSDISRNSSSQRLQALQSDFLEETFESRVAQEKFQALSDELGLSKISADIDSIITATAKTKEERKIKQITVGLMTHTYADTIRLARFEADNAELDNKIKDFDLHKIMPAQLVKLQEEAASIRQSTYLNYEQFVTYRDHLDKVDFVLDEQGRSLKFSNDAMQATFNEYVDKLKNEYHITEVEAQFAATREVMKIVNGAAITLAATGATMFKARSKFPSKSGNSAVPNYMDGWNPPYGFIQ